MVTPTQWRLIFTGLWYINLVVSIDAYETVSTTSSNYTNTTLQAKTEDFSIFGFSTLYSILGLAGAGLLLIIIILIIIAVTTKTPPPEENEEDEGKNNKTTGSKYCIVCQGEEPA